MNLKITNLRLVELVDLTSDAELFPDDGFEGLVGRDELRNVGALSNVAVVTAIGVFRVVFRVGCFL